MAKAKTPAKKTAAAKPAKAEAASEQAKPAEPVQPVADQATPDQQAQPTAPIEPADQANPAEPVPPADEAAPPAAEPYSGPVLVVTGPKTGFRRGGFAFGAEPVELTPADFGVVTPGTLMSADAAERFLAIITEPKLTCAIRDADGDEQLLVAEAIGALRARVETLRAEQGDGPIGELLGELLNA